MAQIRATTGPAITQRDQVTKARWVVAGALAVACVALIAEFATGVPSPGVPPGPIILGVAAVVVAVVRWRWISVLGLAVAGFLTVGVVASGTVPRLLSPAPLGPFVATWVQTLAQLVAVVAALVAITAAARHHSPGRS
jgi:hypothetical protein